MKLSIEKYYLEKRFLFSCVFSVLLHVAVFAAAARIVAVSSLPAEKSETLSEVFIGKEEIASIVRHDTIGRPVTEIKKAEEEPPRRQPEKKPEIKESSAQLNEHASENKKEPEKKIEPKVKKQERSESKKPVSEKPPEKTEIQKPVEEQIIKTAEEPVKQTVKPVESKEEQNALQVTAASTVSESSQDYNVGDTDTGDTAGILLDDLNGAGSPVQHEFRPVFAESRVNTEKIIHNPQAEEFIEKGKSELLAVLPKVEKAAGDMPEYLPAPSKNTESLQPSENVSETVSDTPSEDAGAMEKKYPEENLILQFEFKDLGEGYDRPPSFSYFLKPGYPLWARRSGVEGFVVVRLSISEEGNVTDVMKVESTVGPKLANYVKYVAKRWRFEPRYKDGELAESSVEIKVVFKLIERPARNSVPQFLEDTGEDDVM